VLRQINLTTHVEVGGRVFRIPLTQGLRLPAADEPWLDVIIRRLLAARSGSFIDVGANLGQTLLKVKAVASDASYFGFEPNPRCYCYLTDLISMNRLHACAIYPCALGEAPRIVELFQSSPADPAASIVDGFRAEDFYSSRQFVTVFPGDQVLDDGRARDISTIKIDVEGAERDVLIGLTRTVDSHRPFIICEVLPVYDVATDNGRFRLTRQKEIEAFLRERRYSIHRIGADAGLTKLTEFGVHGDLSSCNYVFVPAERPM